MSGFSIDWNMLLGAANPGNALLQGFEQGRAMRQESDTRSALSAYAAAPSLESANALIALDPRLGMQARTQQLELDQQAAQRAARKAAAQGDPGAMDALAGIDFDAWSKIDSRVRERAKQATGFMGQAVLQVSRLQTEPERAAAWGHFVQQAEASGMDIPAQYERYTPEALNAAAAEAGTMEKLIKQFEPDYRAVPQGGYLENVNPLSRSDPIPSGPGSIPPPPPGFELDGGGPTQPASGSF